MVFAHQGGWDEMLLVLGPILVIVLLLRLARNRAISTSDDEPSRHRLRARPE